MSTHAKVRYFIASIDALLTEQINAILHHSSFQAIEARWRGLKLLTQHHAKNIKIQLLDVSFKELKKDLKYHLEFEQTVLFEFIYSQQFGTAGGEPFTLLLGDYYFNLQSPDDMLLLTEISQISAAAFAPFISSIDPISLGLSSMQVLSPVIDIDTCLKSEVYNYWQRFRRTEDARFVGLTVPQVLMRQSYNVHQPKTQFKFEEYTVDDTESLQLWGHPGYAITSMVMRCFYHSHWFSDLSETPLDFMPAWQHVENFFDTKLEFSLNNAGLMTLSQHGLHQAMYCYSMQSTQQPKIYTKHVANVNSEISSVIKYILCVSRFAHYLKIIARDKVGSFLSSQDCEFYLNQWIGQYVAANELKDDNKVKYPLKNAEIKIKDIPGRNGYYQCIIYLTPRLNFEAANFTVHLVATV